MNLKHFVFAACFVVGVSLIVFHDRLTNYLTSSTVSSALLATVSKMDGKAEIKNMEQKVREAEENKPIYDQETLTVGGSPLRVRFSEGMEVELDAGAIAYFENTDRGVFVNLRSGNFKGIAKGSGKERVLFVKDGMVLDPLGRNIMQPPIKLETKEETVKEKSLETAVTEDTLSDVQITNSMAQLRQPLIKCYAGNLKENSNSKGEVYLSFTIERDGKVSLVRILQESFKDEKFSKCISEVIERAQFDRFKGDPIIVNYPVYFE